MASQGNFRRGSVGVFSLGCIIGAILALLLNFIEEKMVIKTVRPSRTRLKTNPFHLELKDGIKRRLVNFDEMLYGPSKYSDTEAEYLYKTVNVLCIIFVRDDSKALAARNTWGTHCNDLLFFGSPKNYSLPVIQLQSKSSWHFLCETIRMVWKTHRESLQWVLFVPETLFAIPENLRFYVSSFDHLRPYYMGHAIKFWGETYNVAQAGYVLSKGAILALQQKFNSLESCISGGKFWKNEDFYLGKHLGRIGVYPEDTRDAFGRGRFHGYNFNQLLFPGKISSLGSYWTKSVYPMKEGRDCCSDYSITFHGTEPDKIYQHNYLMYRLKVFSHGGHWGNRPAPTPFPEELVWKNFLIEEGLKEKSIIGISSEEFYNLWKEKISGPSQFNKKLKEGLNHKVSFKDIRRIYPSFKGINSSIRQS